MYSDELVIVLNYILLYHNILRVKVFKVYGGMAFTMRRKLDQREQSSHQ